MLTYFYVLLQHKKRFLGPKSELIRIFAPKTAFSADRLAVAGLATPPVGVDHSPLRGIHLRYTKIV